MAVVGQLYAPAVLPSGKELLVTIELEAVWVPYLAGHSGEEKNLLFVLGIEL